MNEPRVVYCTYCRVVVIHAGGKPDSHLVVTVTGDGARVATLDAQPVTIQDGICRSCQHERFPETVRR